MARPASGANFNIDQLERILEERRTELGRLEKERDELRRNLDGVERQIAKLRGAAGRGRGRRGGGGGGAGGGGGRGRARNERSLLDTLEAVMRDGGKPMSVSEIMEAASASGYRSGSANFRGIVNQTLIKDKRFAQVSRGVYQLKGGDGKAKKEKAGED